MKIYVGSSYKGTPTAELKEYKVDDFKTFCQDYLSNCRAGEKNDYYITIGNDYTKTEGDTDASPFSYKHQSHFHRNDKSQKSAWLLPFDGDASIKNDKSCIAPKIAHQVLKKLNLNHVIFTTHSHLPLMRNRWRLFLPCLMTQKEQLEPTVHKVFNLLRANGCDDLALSNESRTWTQPWFLPTRDDPSDGGFKYYSFFEGEDFEPAEPGSVKFTPPEQVSGTDIQDSIEIITKGKTPLHETLRNFIYGSVRDGRQPATIKAILHALTAGYDLSDPRLKNRKEDIDRIVDITYKKFYNESVGGDWLKKEQENERIYTKYPDQGGVFEQMVQYCKSWMVFPNRQIAITAIHTLVSTLGGRVYTTEDGSGIVLTVLITGRSTIGKSNIKKFCVHVLNNFSIGNHAGDFIGSHYYTSGANLIKEMMNSGSLLSVRTESGQSDQSQAGDMKRVMLYELELATESGRNGYISSGGQNDKVPDLYSPAVTTVRESVAEIQNDADIQNKVSVSGTSGRRSHVIIDPLKAPINPHRELKIPKFFVSLVSKLHKLASDARRRTIDKPLAAEHWLVVSYEDPTYIHTKAEAWLEKENSAARSKDHFIATFYGRLYERVPAYAARLAIVENPLAPKITNVQIDIAEASLEAEVFAHRKQDDLGSGPWEVLIEEIKTCFMGDMHKTKSKTLLKGNERLLKLGACMWRNLARKIRYNEGYKVLKEKDNFNEILMRRLELVNILSVRGSEAKVKFGVNAWIFYRT